jgi:hypothetical protein
MPANLVMGFSDHTTTTNAWSLYRLLEIFKAVIASFAPDHATLYDEAHRARPTYDERMFDYDMRRAPSGLYWLNYFSRSPTHRDRQLFLEQRILDLPAVQARFPNPGL